MGVPGSSPGRGIYFLEKKYQKDEVDVILAYIKPIDKVVWIFSDFFIIKDL